MFELWVSFRDGCLNSSLLPLSPSYIEYISIVSLELRSSVVVSSGVGGALDAEGDDDGDPLSGWILFTGVGGTSTRSGVGEVARARRYITARRRV